MNNWLKNDDSQIDYYLNSNDVILAGRRYQIDLLIRLIHHYQKAKNAVFLDFGCGDGVLSKILLERFSGNHIDLLDGSEAMIRKLKEAPLSNSSIIHSSFEEWMNQNVERQYDLIFSSMAIHHLDHSSKNRLYSKIFSALNFGGLFVNMDVVKPASPAVEAFQFDMWKNSVFEQVNHDQEAFQPHENLPFVYKNKAENKPSTLNSQLNMLRDIGFDDVDCHYKNGIFAMFSGVKN